jgi:uncharacterized membrane protein YcaP (DUF421 family)
MDPLRIAVRAVFAYAFALVLARIAGHRTVKQLDVTSFVVTVVMGDLFDDFFWAEVAASQFVVALSSLFFIHLWITGRRTNAGERNWQRIESDR